MDHSKLTPPFGHSPDQWQPIIGPALNSAVRPRQRCPFPLSTVPLEQSARPETAVPERSGQIDMLFRLFLVGVPGDAWAQA
eukprot:229842-Rhodomonas_salina.3